MRHPITARATGALVAAVVATGAVAQNLFVVGAAQALLQYNGHTGEFQGVFSHSGLVNSFGLISGADGAFYLPMINAVGIARVALDGTASEFCVITTANHHTRGLVQGAGGFFYVPYAGRIHKVGPDGTYLGLLNDAGGGDGMEFGTDGKLYYTAGSTVNRYDVQTGVNLGVFASGGGLQGARDLRFGPDGNLYVSDFTNDDVLRYNGITGAFMDVFASGSGLDGPTDLRFGPDGNFYVGSTAGEPAILRFNGQTGHFIDDFAVGGGLRSPQGVVFASVPEPMTLIALSLGIAILVVRRSRLRTLGVSVCGAFLICAYAHADSITFLGPYGSNDFLATALSGDGTTVVGSISNIERLGIWKEGVGYRLLLLPSGSYLASANAVSFDGSKVLVVGEASSYARTYIWSESGGYQQIASNSGNNFLRGEVMSGDGRVVAGEIYDTTGNQYPFIWDAQNGLLTPPGRIHDLSYDGTVAVGISSGGAFRWDRTNVQILGNGGANGVSPDGMVVVGSYQSQFDSVAFRWSEATGYQTLLNPEPAQIAYSFSRAADCNDGGSIILGSAVRNIPLRESVPAIWTPATGWVSIKNYLIGEGVVGAANIFGVSQMSYEGHTILGFGPGGPFLLHISFPLAPLAGQSPQQMAVNRGRVIAGGLPSLEESDNNYLELGPGPVLNTSQDPVDMTLEATLPRNPNIDLRFLLESHVSSPNIAVKLQLYNFTLSRWVSFEFREAMTQDERMYVVPHTSWTDYAAPNTRRVLAHVTWRATGPVLGYPWRVSIDQARWIIDWYY